MAEILFLKINYLIFCTQPDATVEFNSLMGTGHHIPQYGEKRENFITVFTEILVSCGGPVLKTQASRAFHAMDSGVWRWGIVEFSEAFYFLIGGLRVYETGNLVEYLPMV